MVVRCAVAGAAGLAWTLAAPPRGWWVLFPLGVAAFSIALYGAGVRLRVVLGAVCGLVLHGVGLVWMTDFSVAGYVAVALLETCLLVAAAAAMPSARDGRWSGGWWALPAALVLMEAVQARFPFGGFPLPALVYSQVDGPFVGAAPLGGSLLVTGTAAAAGVALAALVVERGRGRVWVAATALVVAIVPVAAGATVTTSQDGQLDVVAVQGGGPRGVRAIFTDSMITTERHLAALEEVRPPVDLVVLPENVADTDGLVAESELSARFAGQAQRLRAHVVVGVTEGVGDRFRNVAVLWGPDGERVDSYTKEHRVPFGEYIPARGLFELLSDNTRFVPRDAVAGSGEALLDAAGTELAVAISYEVFFADRVAEGVRAGGEVLLVPTNASSYVTDQVPSLELAAARMRAREFGRAVVMSAPTGYSAIVHADGDVVDRSALGERALLRETVPLRSGLTPYAHVGDVPVIVLASALIVAPALLRARRRRRMAGEQARPA
ncbi:apolipoprotein N-acyltransferase [Haloactinopolyspora alba]|uniref:Apolipoprotein N-acyltransferase n=1 Tax=Haloactinopolyspora alba TaxID=648780 RepID=A0A2P8EF01_9ACTN|nr:apolipoprotein N-acyltransferase [Haloactinopolyspora alba]